MGTEKSIETKKNSWVTGLKAEFSKIMWPTKAQITKETTAVVVVSVVLGVVIAILDFVIQFGLDKIISL